MNGWAIVGNRHLVPTCADGGVLGTLAGIVGTWQASEVLKWVLGIGKRP